MLQHILVNKWLKGLIASDFPKQHMSMFSNPRDCSVPVTEVPDPWSYTHCSAQHPWARCWTPTTLLLVQLVCSMTGYRSWWAGGTLHDNICHQCINVCEWVNAVLCCEVLGDEKYINFIESIYHLFSFIYQMNTMTNEQMLKLNDQIRDITVSSMALKTWY